MPAIPKNLDFEEVPELDKVFEECMERFPELENRDLQLKVVRNGQNGHGDRLEGAKARVKGQEAVILWVPRKVWGKWDALRPIIYHELSHYVDLHNPDRVFFQRADDKSKMLWEMLQKAGAVRCEVPDQNPLRDIPHFNENTIGLVS